MKLQTIEYVLEIARCGSINKAARNLYLSQPNLSGSVRALENELGFKLFRRKNSGVELTPEGAEFIKSAKRIHLELEKIQKIPALFQEYRDLSVTSTYSALFFQIFMAYQEQHSAEDVQDTFKETGLIQTFQDVVEQKYRLSIFYCFECRKGFHKSVAERYGLEMIPLYAPVPVEVLVSVSNPIVKKGELSLDEIANYPIITYEDFKYEDWLGVLHVGPAQRVTKIFDRGGLCDTICGSGAIAIVKKGSMNTRGRSGCTTLPIKGQQPMLGIHMLKQKNYPLSYREKEFVKFLKKYLTKYYCGT